MTKHYLTEQQIHSPIISFIQSSVTEVKRF